MWDQVMTFLTVAVTAAVSWFDKIIDAIGAAPIILAVVGLALVVGLLLMPLRGGGIPSFTGDLTVNHTSQYKPQHKQAVSSKKSAVKSAKQYAKK